MADIYGFNLSSICEFILRLRIINREITTLRGSSVDEVLGQVLANSHVGAAAASKDGFCTGKFFILPAFPSSTWWIINVLRGGTLPPKTQYTIQKNMALKHVLLSQSLARTNVFFLFFPDIFYYLKDPPPEFLPRFGTITMAGLLGMFLARKGDVTFPY